MRHTRRWGYFDGSNARPVPKDPDHPTDAEELAAEQWDREDETAGYLMSQRLPDLVILDIGDFTTTREQWDVICSIFTAKTEYAMTDLHQSFLDMKCPRGGNVREFLASLKTRRHELRAIGVTITDPEFKRTMLRGIPDSLSTFAAQTLNSLTIASRYTGKPVDMSELIDMVSEEADRAKTRRVPKDQTGKGKNESHNDEALAVTDGNGKKHRKGKCHHCQKEGHWARECFTKKREEEAAKAQSGQAAQGSTSTSKPENKPVGSANIATIDDDSDGNGFWVVEEEIHAHTAYLVPDPEMSNSDTESDDNDEASRAELTGAEDEQAPDWLGSDDQLASEGEESHAEEEASTATLEEEDAPRSEAQPIPHHALHAPVISHTPASSGEPDKEGHAFRIITTRGERIAERQNQTLLELLWVLWHVIWVWLLKPLWGAALQLTTLFQHASEALYWTSPVEGMVRCAQASLLEGEGMRTPSTSSEQSAAPATPSTFIAPKSLATPSEATLAAVQPPWAVRFFKPSRVRVVRNPQPGDGLAHSGSHAPHLTSSLQVPGIADDPDEAGGVRTVGYDASASFEGVEDTQEALAVETADAEALEPCSLPEAANVERHTSHLLAQDSSRVSGIDPDGPEPSPTQTDHPVTFPVDQAPASAAVRAMTHDVPYREVVDIHFAATLGPALSESAKRIPLTVSDTPDPPSTHAEGNSPTEGSANASGSTTKDRRPTSGHAFFINGGTLPRLSQRLETALPSTTERDHVAAAHSDAEASRPRYTSSLIPGDLMPPSTLLSDSPAAVAPPRGHQHHLQTKHIDVHHHQTIETGLIRPASCPMDDTLTDALTKPLPLAKAEHFAASLGLRAK